MRAVDELSRHRQGVLPLYEFVLDEKADLVTRQAAAEALVRLGLLRRGREGASRPFLWLVGMTLVIVAAAAVDTIGVVGAIVLLVAGTAALVAYYRRMTRKERASGTYIGPDAATITIPAIAPPG
jgi:Flp pilus assembly protein TadB